MFLFTTPTQPSGGDVHSALRFASERTGVNFDYLLSTAQRESGLDSSAQAKTSSARGLFQFIESTWLSTLRDSGAALGYAEYADKISVDRSGRAVVADRAARQEILELRDDPEAAALMAGALARQNAAAMQAQLGRAPEAGELYLAHFLGAQGAVEMVSLAANEPEASAAGAFPAAARANRAIFYARDGSARSALDVYRRLTSLPQAGPVAAADAAEPLRPGAGLFTAKADAGQPFHSMFSDVNRGMGPIASAVASMWRQKDGEGQPEAGRAGEATVTAHDVTAGRATAATASLTATDGRPLDITPGAVDEALRSYAQAAQGAAAKGPR